MKKKEEKYHIFHPKITIFIAVKNRSILHGHVCVINGTEITFLLSIIYHMSFKCVWRFQRSIGLLTVDGHCT